MKRNVKFKTRIALVGAVSLAVAAESIWHPDAKPHLEPEAPRVMMVVPNAAANSANVMTGIA